MLCHGDSDPVVPHKWGQESAALLKKFTKSVDFRTYKNLPHSSSDKVYILTFKIFKILHIIFTIYFELVRKWAMSRYLYSSACHLSRYIIKTIIESGNQEEKREARQNQGLIESSLFSPLLHDEKHLFSVFSRVVQQEPCLESIQNY